MLLVQIGETLYKKYYDNFQIVSGSLPVGYTVICYLQKKNDKVKTIYNQETY